MTEHGTQNSPVVYCFSLALFDIDFFGNFDEAGDSRQRDVLGLGISARSLWHLFAGRLVTFVITPSEKVPPLTEQWKKGDWSLGADTTPSPSPIQEIVKTRVERISFAICLSAATTTRGAARRERKLRSRRAKFGASEAIILFYCSRYFIIIHILLALPDADVLPPLFRLPNNISTLIMHIDHYFLFHFSTKYYSSAPQTESMQLRRAQREPKRKMKEFVNGNRKFSNV